MTPQFEDVTATPGDSPAPDFNEVTVTDAPPAADTSTETTSETTEKPVPAEGIDRIPETPTEEKPVPAAAVTGDPAKPAFTPNFKYRGDAAEKEVPEFFRSLIKDAESEAMVKSVLAKADGLDTVKVRAEAVRVERDNVKKEFGTVQNALNDAKATYQRGDLDQFFEKLAIPKERVLQWALEKVQYNQLPPEQKAMVDSKMAAERQLYATQQLSQQTSQQLMSKEAEFLQNSMNYELQRPDVTEFSKAFDEVTGKPGNFFNEVKKVGELHWMRSGGKALIPANQAIKEVMDAYANVAKVRAAPAANTAAPAPQTTATTAAKPKPTVIPNVAGKQASPIKAGPKSTDDLRKLAAEFGKTGS